jgi:cytochrome d ubiquinol oxidase subunit II
LLLSIVIFFLALSLVFYVLFGGADFGAGILQMISNRENRKEITHAIGPVWEANHVWLILVVVILFMGFPKVYSVLSTYLHIPIVLMLIGIILRGTAFTFMHYDAITDNSQFVYERIFKISSIVTPLFLGVIVGAIMLGRIDPNAATFYEAFVAPWFNLFSFTVGAFVICIFTFLAAVFMIAETKEEIAKSEFTRIARRMQAAIVINGLLVFVTAYVEKFPLAEIFLNSPLALASMALATMSLPVLWRFLNTGNVLFARLTAGFQILMILIGWFWIQYPDVIRTTEQHLSLYSTAAPPATLLQLVVALIIGSLIILPALYYLMKTFKGEQFRREDI